MACVELTGFPEISESVDSLRSVVEATGYSPDEMQSQRNGKVVLVMLADGTAAQDVASQLDGLYYDADHSLQAKVLPKGLNKQGAGAGLREQLAKFMERAEQVSSDRQGRNRSRSRSPRRNRWNDSDNLNFQVELSNLPDAYTHESLVELHDYLELPARKFESTRFDDRRSIAICRYADESSARSAAEALHGQEVVDIGGEMRVLEARVRASSGPAKVLPSVYISDVPLNFTEDALREMHDKEGLDHRTLSGVKLLNSKNPSSGTTCCIARYHDTSAAEAAIARLKGKPVVTDSGVVKFLGMRMAKPATWMTKSGRADEQQQLYNDSKRQTRKSKPFRHRLDRFSDRFCLDRPTVVWLSRMPLEVQTLILEEFDSRANDASLEDREEMAVQLRLFAESVHPESAGDAPTIGPAPWEELEPSNPLAGFAERWKLSKGDIKWFSGLSKEVQWHAMEHFNPDKIKSDWKNRSGEILRKFVANHDNYAPLKSIGDTGDKGKVWEKGRYDNGWDKGLDKGWGKGWDKSWDKGWGKGGWDKGWGKGGWDKGWGKPYGKGWDDGKSGKAGKLDVPPPPAVVSTDPWQFGPTPPPPPSSRTGLPRRGTSPANVAAQSDRIAPARVCEDGVSRQALPTTAKARLPLPLRAAGRGGSGLPPGDFDGGEDYEAFPGRLAEPRYGAARPTHAIPKQESFEEEPAEEAWSDGQEEVKEEVDNEDWLE